MHRFHSTRVYMDWSLYDLYGSVRLLVVLSTSTQKKTTAATHPVFDWFHYKNTTYILISDLGIVSPSLLGECTVRTKSVLYGFFFPFLCFLLGAVEYWPYRGLYYLCQTLLGL